MWKKKRPTEKKQTKKLKKKIVLNARARTHNYLPAHSHSRFFIDGRCAAFFRCQFVHRLTQINIPKPTSSIPQTFDLVCGKNELHNAGSVLSISFFHCSYKLSNIFYLFIVMALLCRWNKKSWTHGTPRFSFSNRNSCNVNWLTHVKCKQLGSGI